jgi:hypothetical protein
MCTSYVPKSRSSGAASPANRIVFFLPCGRLFSHCLIRMVLLFAARVIATRSASAGIIYTWIEDDVNHPGMNGSGFLEVTNAAQTAGMITAADVLNFSFDADGTSSFPPLEPNNLSDTHFNNRCSPRGLYFARNTLERWYEFLVRVI